MGQTQKEHRELVEGVPMDRVRDDVLLSHVTARSPQSKCACTVCECERETTLPVCDPCNFNIHLYKAKVTEGISKDMTR